MPVRHIDMKIAVGIIAAAPAAVVATGRSRRMPGWLEDAGLLLLIALAFPLAVLVVGAPVALVVRFGVLFTCTHVSAAAGRSTGQIERRT